jgi:hypothetical protein
MFAPMDVKAKRQLYCLIARINLLETGPPSNWPAKLEALGEAGVEVRQPSTALVVDECVGRVARLLANPLTMPENGMAV